VPACFPSLVSDCFVDELKLLGDLVHAIPTQCVQLKRAQECKPQVLANICLKVNAKLNGTNFVISPEHR
jgi:eukaryotic translation initiation factor 2C